jgi:hypothetical protein
MYQHLSHKDRDSGKESPGCFRLQEGSRKMRHTANLIARLADYAPKKERRAITACARRLPPDIDCWDEVRLIKLASNTLSLFLLGNAEINLSPYGAALSLFSVELPNGKRRLHHNELTHGMDVRCEALRDFFVGMESMLRCGCGITEIITPQKACSTEPLGRREIERFCNACGAGKVVCLVHLLLDARNSFCHSLVKCENIRYNDEPLDLCFSKVYFYRNCKRYETRRDAMLGMRFFEEDAFAASELLITGFRKIQHRQINVKVLSEFITEFLKEEPQGDKAAT